MKTKLRLFRVTLPWGLGEGDYCESVWAKDDDEAIKKVATNMADGRDHETKAERRGFIEERIANAEPYAAEEVAVTIQDAVYNLLAGPKGGALDPKREAVRCTIINLLHLYGYGAEK